MSRASLLSAALALIPAAAPASAAGPGQVTVGAYVNDVQNLDLKSHSYAVDLYLWFRWRDPKLDPAQTLEFINPFELWGHVKTVEFEKPVRLPDGSFYQVVRNNGRFSKKLPLNDYPFDRQILTVEFEDGSSLSDRLTFKADEPAVTLNPRLQLPGFTIGEPRLIVGDFVYPTDFGDPRTAKNAIFSRVRLELPISRPVLTHGVKRLLPILCVLLCSALMFLFQPKYVDARVGIGITALLTIVALQITLNADLPEVHYLVLMDLIYLGAYIFVIVGLAVVVKTTWMMEKGDAAKARRLEYRSLAVLLTLFGLYLAWTLWSGSGGWRVR